jgi:hypothetical protein
MGNPTSHSMVFKPTQIVIFQKKIKNKNKKMTTPTHAQRLHSALDTTTYQLSLSERTFEDPENLPVYYRAIAQNTSLHALRFFFLDYIPKEFPDLCTELVNQDHILRLTLVLNRNILESYPFACICPLISSATSCLTELFIIYAHITYNDLLLISRALATNTSITTLTLTFHNYGIERIESDCPRAIKGIVCIGDALATNTCLRKLVIATDTIVCTDIFHSIAAAFDLNPNIVFCELVLTHLKLISTGDTRNVASLISIAKRLHTLVFIRMKLSSRFMNSLANLLHTNDTYLANLSFFHVPLQDSTPNSLIDALALNTTLTSLTFDKTKFSPTAVPYMRDALSINTTLTHLRFVKLPKFCNAFTSDDVHAIFARNSTLSEIIHSIDVPVLIFRLIASFTKRNERNRRIRQTTLAERCKRLIPNAPAPQKRQRVD